MAQSTATVPGLDGFLSIVQSLASELAQSTASPSTLAISILSQPTSTAASTTSASFTSAIQSSGTASPTTTATAATASSDFSRTPRIAIVVVCSVVGALLLALLALLIYCCVRRKRKRRQRGEPIAKEETREIDTPLRANDWYHGNDSHHGFVGAPVIGPSQIGPAGISQDKKPRHSISGIENPIEPPNLADHPAFAREAFTWDSDPYKAAGVGSAALAGAGTAAARRSGEDLASG